MLTVRMRRCSIHALGGDEEHSPSTYCISQLHIYCLTTIVARVGNIQQYQVTFCSLLIAVPTHAHPPSLPACRWHHSIVFYSIHPCSSAPDRRLLYYSLGKGRHRSQIHRIDSSRRCASGCTLRVYWKSNG